jgi:hypothetical protein
MVERFAFSLRVSLGPRTAATPARRKLAFDIFVTRRAAPAFMSVCVCRFALQKSPQQIIGAREFDIIHYPYFAQICGQFADATRQKFTAHDNVDTL